MKIAKITKNIWTSLSSSNYKRIVANKNICISKCGARHNGFLSFSAKRLIVDNCDEDFIHHNLHKKVFPNLQEILLSNITINYPKNISHCLKNGIGITAIPQEEMSKLIEDIKYEPLHICDYDEGTNTLYLK